MVPVCFSHCKPVARDWCQLSASAGKDSAGIDDASAGDANASNTREDVARLNGASASDANASDTGTGDARINGASAGDPSVVDSRAGSARSRPCELCRCSGHGPKEDQLSALRKQMVGWAEQLPSYSLFALTLAPSPFEERSLTAFLSLWALHAATHAPQPVSASPSAAHTLLHSPSPMHYPS